MTVLIGGRSDGKSVRVPEDRHRVDMPIPYEFGDDFIKEGEPIVEKVEFRLETFVRMQFRGNDKTFEVFVLEGMSADQAFEALIGAYGKRGKGMEFVTPKQTERGRVIRFEMGA